MYFMGFSVKTHLVCSFFLFFILYSSGSLQAQTADVHIRAEIDSARALSFQYITSNPQRALTQLKAAERLADSLGYKEAQAEILSHLSTCQTYLGNQDESVAYRMKSIEFYEQLGMLYEAGHSYALLGWGTRKRDLVRGEYFMNKGIQMLENFPDSPELSNAYNNYGIIKLDQNQVDSAILFVNKSLDIKIKNEDTLGIAYSYGYLASAYQELGQLDRAIRYLDQSYELKEQMKDSSGMAVDLTNIAALYQDQGNSALAIKNFQSSLNLALRVHYHELAEHNYQNLSNYFESQADYDSALYYQKAFYEFYKDRVNENTNKRLAELEVQFDTEEKEKELAIKRVALTQEQLKVKQRNWVLSALGGLFLVGFFITGLFFRQQKIKQENLERESRLKLQLSTVEMENKIHQERERISKDLHDNVGSQISNLIIGLEIGNLHLRKDQQDEAFKMFSTLDEDARSAMTVLRETIWLLDKNQISFQQFLEHIKDHFRRQQSYLGIMKTEINSAVPASFALTAAQSLNLTRIIQEALNNAKKYASATCFKICFGFKDNTLHIEIKDNGKGMNADTASIGGFGLQNMRERAKTIQADFTLTSTPENGTHIHLTIPILNIP